MPIMGYQSESGDLSDKVHIEHNFGTLCHKYTVVVRLWELKCHLTMHLMPLSHSLTTIL